MRRGVVLAHKPNKIPRSPQTTLRLVAGGSCPEALTLGGRSDRMRAYINLQMQLRQFRSSVGGW
jgi:hypothetical protein